MGRPSCSRSSSGSGSGWYMACSFLLAGALPAVPLVAVAVLAVAVVAVAVSCPVLPVAAAQPLALLGEPLQRGADRMPVLPLSWPVAAGLAAQDRTEPACMWGELPPRTLTVRSCRAVLRGVVGVVLPAMPSSSL